MNPREQFTNNVMEDASRLVARVEQLCDELTRLREEATGLRESLKSSRRYVAELEAKQHQGKLNVVDVNKMTAHADNLTRRLANVTKRNELFQDELEQHATELVRLRSENIQQKSRFESLQQKCQSDITLRNQAMDEVEGHKTRLREVEGQLANLKRDSEDMYANNSKLHQQVDDLKKQLAPASDKCPSCKSDETWFRKRVSDDKYGFERFCADNWHDGVAKPEPKAIHPDCTCVYDESGSLLVVRNRDCLVHGRGKSQPC